MQISLLLKQLCWSELYILRNWTKSREKLKKYEEVYDISSEYLLKAEKIWEIMSKLISNWKVGKIVNDV